MTYRDDLGAAVARAEEAERRAAEAEAELARVLGERTNAVVAEEVGDRLYLGVGGCVVAVTASRGEIAWKTRLSSSGTVLVVAGHAGVYAGSRGRVHRVDPGDGRVLWTNGLRGLRYGLPMLAIVPRGMAPAGVVFAALQSTVLCLDAATGEERWRQELKSRHASAQFANLALIGRYLVTTTKGEAFCLDAAGGARLWHAPLKGLGLGLVSVAPNGLGHFALAAEDKERRSRSS